MSAAAAMSATLVSWSPFFASTRVADARRSRRVRSRRRSKRFIGATRSEVLFISEYRFTIRYRPLLSSTPGSPCPRSAACGQRSAVSSQRSNPGARLTGRLRLLEQEGRAHVANVDLAVLEVDVEAGRVAVERGCQERLAFAPAL